MALKKFAQDTNSCSKFYKDFGAANIFQSLVSSILLFSFKIKIVGFFPHEAAMTAGTVQQWHRTLSVQRLRIHFFHVGNQSGVRYSVISYVSLVFYLESTMTCA